MTNDIKNTYRYSDMVNYLKMKVYVGDVNVPRVDGEVFMGMESADYRDHYQVCQAAFDKFNITGIKRVFNKPYKLTKIRLPEKDKSKVMRYCAEMASRGHIVYYNYPRFASGTLYLPTSITPKQLASFMEDNDIFKEFQLIIKVYNANQKKIYDNNVYEEVIRDGEIMKEHAGLEMLPFDIMNIYDENLQCKIKNKKEKRLIR